jgi:hypothetical protein
MFLLNTILAWNINIIMNKKYDNNNIIIASRAYFLQIPTIRSQTLVVSVKQRERNIDVYGSTTK